MGEADAENDRGFTIKKKVDESWKSAVEKEKSKDHPAPKAGPEPSPEPEQPEPLERGVPPEPDFPFFISTLGMQALAALGEVPNPATGEKRMDRTTAKYFIDILVMLSQKTKGNLTAEENAMVNDLLYELQMKFVQKSQGL